MAHRSFPRRVPPRIEPRAGRRGVLRGQHAVGLIAAGAAILGAVAGGWATYLGNRSLERQQSYAAARGTARVLQAEFESVDVRLAAMLQQHRMFRPDPGPSISLSLADRKLIATNLSADEWEAVATALAAIRREAAVDLDAKQRAAAGVVVELDAPDMAYYRSTAVVVSDAIHALDGLAGTRY